MMLNLKICVPDTLHVTLYNPHMESRAYHSSLTGEETDSRGGLRVPQLLSAAEAGFEAGWACFLAPNSAFFLHRQPPALGLPQPQSARGGDGRVCEFAHPDAVLLSEVCFPEEIQPDPLAPCPWLVLPVRGLWVSP